MNHLLKLKAFFHDPIDKPFDIRGHEARSREYLQALGVDPAGDEELVRSADHIASAVERIAFPRGEQVEFCKQALLTHPLGCGTIRLTENQYGYQYLRPDMEQIKQAVVAALGRIRQRSGNDYKKLLLDLWRNFPEELRQFEADNFRLGNVWNILPAETRIPNHSILDHCWLTAAIAGCLPNPAFLRFSFGPVQGFVTSARRTEDYWAGSYILAFLAAQALKAIIEELGPEHVIFPKLKGQPLIDKILADNNGIAPLYALPEHIAQGGQPSLPNVIVALVPRDAAKQLAETMRGNLHSKFRDLADWVKNEFTLVFAGDVAERLWEGQIQDFLEVYYNILPWPKDAQQCVDLAQRVLNHNPGNDPRPRNYSPNQGTYWEELYKVLDAGFNSRKNLRTFRQPQQPATNFPRCSLCGERDVLHANDTRSTSDLTALWESIAKDNHIDDRFRRRLDPKGREKLCSVCLTKRMSAVYFAEQKYVKFTGFPSTGTIAALTLKQKIIGCFTNNRNDAQHTGELLMNVNEYNESLECLGIRPVLDVRQFPRVLEDLKKVGETAFPVLRRFFEFDGYWMFKESFEKSALEEEGIAYTENNQQTIKIIRETLKYFEGKVDAPSKYYAVIVMDGDSMGKWLSATHPRWPKWRDVVHPDSHEAVEQNAPGLLDQGLRISGKTHGFISDALGEFSLQLARYAVEEKFPGKLLYAGGDDVVALMPLEYALEAAELVRFSFSGQLGEDGMVDITKTTGYAVLIDGNSKRIIPTMGPKATMSAGIVIAHKDQNLGEVFKQAYQALHTAKEANNGARNAFCLRISRRSGNVTEVVTPWTVADDQGNLKRTTKAVKSILEKIAIDETHRGISMSFFGKAFQLKRQLGGDQADIYNLWDPLLVLTIKRSVQKGNTQREAMSDQEIQNLVAEMQNSLKTLAGANRQTPMDWLLVLRFLAEGGRR